MTFFDIFKRSRKEVIKDNQQQGKAGEEQVKAKYELNGYKVTRTGRGHDYRATKKNWLNGKRETKYVEVKTGNSKLSPLQKKKKRQLGSKYVEERVNPNPLWGVGSSRLFGTSTPQRNKKSSKSSSASLLELVFGPSPSRKQKRKKNSGSIWGTGRSTSIWGPSSPSKKKRKPRKSKSVHDAFWGSSSNSHSSDDVHKAFWG